MQTLIWEDKMSAGIKSVDIQRQNLFNTINNFYNAIGNSSGNELITDLLNKIKEYSVFMNSKGVHWLKH